MQTGFTAQRHLGYYCAQEFDLDVFERYRSETVELGRACIAKEHRNFQVLSILWRGIASYAQAHGARYLIGCSSLTSQRPAEGLAAYGVMQPNLAPVEFRTHPHASHTCLTSDTRLPDIKLPKLLSAYLSLGAWICGPPAIDRQFKTIDFLTLMDLQSDSMKLRRQRFGITN
jgi:putative hemolysin